MHPVFERANSAFKALKGFSKESNMSLILILRLLLVSKKSFSFLSHKTGLSG